MRLRGPALTVVELASEQGCLVAPGTSAMTVALHGRDGMPDQALCASLFEPPPSPLAGGPTGRPPSDLDFGDGPAAARRVRALLQAGMGHGGLLG